MKNGYEKYEPFFGVWKIRKEIGSGSFGKVFEVERKEFGITYASALKIISIPQSQKEIRDGIGEGMTRADVTAYYQEMVKNVIKETEMMSQMKGNSNIVSYEDHQVIQHEDGIGCDIIIRMELLTPLKEYLSSNPFTEADALKMGMDICQALEICGKKNIIHRDIKPENIFVSENGDYKLGDFGIARSVEEIGSDFSKKGTYSYMAPEVYQGLEYGPDVDLYSLGLVLYRIFNNNRMPFLPDYPKGINYREKNESLKRRLAGEKIPMPANASKEIGKILLKACAYEKKNRYHTAEELKRALEVQLKNADDENDQLWVCKEATEGFLALENSEEKTAPEIDVDFTVNKEEAAVVSEKAEPELIEKILSEDKTERRGKKKIIVSVIIGLVLVIALSITGYQYVNRKIEVPGVIGMKEKEAKETIESAGFILEKDEAYSGKIEKGKVISQSRKAGEKRKRKTVVEIVVSKGKEYVELIDFQGVTKKEAEKLAKKIGLKLEFTEVFDETIEAGKIAGQEIPQGKQIEKGAVLKVSISKGREKVQVPDFYGKSQGEVTNLCNGVGITPSFIWEYSEDAEQGYAIGQDLAAGSEIQKGDSVMITLSKGKDESRSSDTGTMGNAGAGSANQIAPPMQNSAGTPQTPAQPQETQPPVDTGALEQEALEELLDGME